MNATNGSILGEGNWRIHWRKKKKKPAPNKEALPTSTNEDPPAADAIVNNPEEDPYNMFIQNTPMAPLNVLYTS